VTMRASCASTPPAMSPPVFRSCSTACLCLTVYTERQFQFVCFPHMLPTCHITIATALTCVLVVQHCVPVAERAALHILPAQPHVVALRQQRGKRERLSSGPVNLLACRVRFSKHKSASVHDSVAG
jgi:hypothetical protein